MAITENRVSWETLQKGQIAELAFERIALAHDYAVKYHGRQYTGVILPSKYRQDSDVPGPENSRADFQLQRREGEGWVHFAVVEVRWRAERRSMKVPPGTNFLVLFTPDELLGAEVAADGAVGPLVALPEIKRLGFRKEVYQEILAATQALQALIKDGIPERAAAPAGE